MKKVVDQKVQQHLQELEQLDPEKLAIVLAARKVVYAEYPKVTERMMYGGIMFTLKEDFGGLFASKNHVSFEFGSGYKMKDPHNHLEGTGKFRRHIKLKTTEDVDKKKVGFYVKQVQCRPIKKYTSVVLL